MTGTSGAATKGLSIPATTRAVRAVLGELDWKRTKLADVGAGRGYFCALLSEELAARGFEPAAQLFPCDLLPDSFAVPGLACAPIGPGGRLPYADEAMDAVVAIEVVEHVEDQFAFLRELARVTRPGGTVVVTTPNVLSLTSRVRTLLWGFPELFDPLPWEQADVRFTTGHIHPIHPWFLAHAALRAGLVEPVLAGDRHKRSSMALGLPLALPLLLARAAHLCRLRRKAPAVLARNAALLRQLGGFGMLTARTAILCARKPAGSPPP
ncbi:MAG: class I SAM-dependent methyltransferase [Planctomycetes bacterium]|nr:class I SAM-dependent methyltransferase [Planctomycetota bacterium]